MRKPVVAVVDDDRAVLEALETSLGPALGNVCRVEAFDDPRGVLERVPEWAAEERRLAVLLVDQKMPGMTGVELLLQLRALGSAPDSETRRHPEFDPVRHARSVLLTGYAELDVALEAKNHAGIDAYARKPWETEALIGGVRTLVIRHLADTAEAAFLEIREAIDLPEIHALLAHRSRALRYGAFGMHRPELAGRAELDGWDMRARHLGVWLEGSPEPEPIASLRVFGTKPSTLGEAVRAGKLAGIDPATASAPVPAAFPVLAYHAEADGIRRYLGSAVGEGEEVVETTIPVFVGEIRDEGAVRMMLAAATAFGWTMVGADHALVFAPPALRGMYGDLGFAGLAGTATGPEASSWSCLAAKASRKPGGTLPMVEMGFAALGTACYCRSYPACLPGPYVSGDFRDRDVFCPREAAGRERG